MVRVRIDCYLSPECQAEDPLRTNVLKALEGQGFDAEARSLFCRAGTGSAAEGAARPMAKGIPVGLLSRKVHFDPTSP